MVTSRNACRPRVTLMADYGCFTWTSSRELFPVRPTPGSPLDLRGLGASNTLVVQLEEWHAEWERAAFGEQPAAGDNPATWERRGWSLARRLQEELPDLLIEVWDERADRVIPIPPPEVGPAK